MRIVLSSGVMLALTITAAPMIAAEYHAPAFHPAYRDWEACLMGKAIQYSKGPDSVETIVHVALWACKDEKNKFTKNLYEQTKKDGYGLNANIDAKKTADIIQGGMTKDAEVLVLELRSGSVLAPSLK
jgi:cytochrome c oxidase assembly factor CtaG